jgi:hypothetical protein
MVMVACCSNGKVNITTRCLSDLVAFVPSVFGRNLQRDPVRKWTERNDIGPFYRLFTYNPGNTLARFKREQA